MNYQDTITTIDAVLRTYGIKSSYNNKICGYIIKTQKVLAYLLFNLDEYDNNKIQIDFDIIQGNEEDLQFYRQITLMLKSSRKRTIDEI